MASLSAFIRHLLSIAFPPMFYHSGVVEYPTSILRQFLFVSFHLGDNELDGS